MQTMQAEWKEMKKSQEKQVMKYFIDSICPFLFYKDLYLPPFPRGLEIPKFDKYLGNSDPQYHIWEFYAQCMEFMQEKTYLMRLFL